MKQFKTISELHKAQGYPLPENPLFGIKTFDGSTPKLNALEYRYNFYFICFKRLESGQIYYGKTKYDHNSGFMYFMKPNQLITTKDVVIKDKGFSIEIHEDFLIGHPLFNEIKKYDFFEYETNEALHLTPKEEETMWTLFNKIEIEYNNNPDEFSKEIILSHLDSIFKYAQRFYKRQFIDRKPISTQTVSKFNNLLQEYFESGDIEKDGIPSVNYLASRLNISSKYLSDLLKQETGKTAIDLLHLYLIRESKHLIIEGEKSITEIAYQLGFENPPYFTRLFKKEVGLTPKEYRKQVVN